MNGSVDANLPADFPQRLDASVTNWKRKLLDLSRRNRALNFKSTKVSTIAIVDEHPAEVFRHLYLEEAAMRFRAAEAQTEAGTAAETEVIAGESVILESDDQEAASESEEALEFIPYDTASVDERHKDEWLQTRLAPEALDHALRRIDEQARTAIEEQGVNTLFLTLGMLQHREQRDSETWFHAPLVFLPVRLARKTARAGYGLSVTDDDALVNPALVEYLRGTYGISLPELPDSETIAETYDLQVFLKGVAEAVSNHPGWMIQTDMYLGLFSFQKLVMFKDLEAHAVPIGQHRLIRQLLSRSGSPVHGLPPEIRNLPLDTAFSPETTHQVVDADSSQMRAAAAVAKGHDIVIEGPPGTGKSQTITNLVAQALAAGKSVLFVAEKMAALEVVHRRLSGAGLGEFCLELHSSKANKRAVMKELAEALDASLQPIAARAAAGRRLPEVRTALADYVQAVHEPFGPLARSPYAVSGDLGLVLKAPKIRLTVDIAGATGESLAAAERALRDLMVHAGAVGQPAAHPWRDTGRTFYSEDDLDGITDIAGRIETATGSLLAWAGEISSVFRLPTATTLDEVEALAELAELLGDSPGVAPDVLRSDSWNAPPIEATTAIETLRQVQTLRDRLTPKLTAEAFEIEHEADAAYVEGKRSGVFGFLAFLDGRYRALMRRWAAYRSGGDKPSWREHVDDLRAVDRLARLKKELASKDAAARGMFGLHWQGLASDAARLEAYVAYVVRYRRVAIQRSLAAETADVALRERPDVSRIRQAVTAAGALRATLRELGNAVAWPDGYLDRRPLSEIGTRAGELARNIGKAQAWAAFEGSRQRAMATIGAEAVDACLAGQAPFDQLCDSFLRAFYMKWLSAAIQARPPLYGFDTLSHEGLVDEFRQLDEQVLQQNRIGLIGMLRDRVQLELLRPEVAASLPQLRKEMSKQRRLSPLRKTLRECDATIRAIKPCFLMSPLTVAQYLDGRQPTFDLVIFDEASQLPAEDAIGAIVRGQQLVVVGDPKQLPPTNFFAVSSGAVTAPLGDDGTPLYEDSESVLEEFMGAAVPMSRLKWHYRSAHESLINFSNVNFYEADLHTFPSVVTDTDAAGLQFHFVEGGVYEGKGVNIVEARRIADEVVRFAKLQLERQALGEAPSSLGVGTLNSRQQLAILDELEVRRRDDPSIEPFFARDAQDAFFVKNLENIQGDERDSIFLSITYGKGADGRIRYNFGPLNRENGWRRLNVLVTRARRQMKVFSSIRDHDINPAGVTSEGPRLLRDFLAYAEHRRLARAVAGAASTADDAASLFERDVHLELTNRGLRLQSQVGVCGYRVDLGVLDDEVAGRFVCGIECDGVAYHSMQTVRDRDRLRQQVLEDRGWIIHRVWSTDWFKDRQGQIERLLRLVEEARTKVRLEAVQAREEKRQALMAPPIAPVVHEPPRAAEKLAAEKPIYKRPAALAHGRVRSRRPAPDEIGEAVRLVLGQGHAFQRQALITETRAVLGYSRTGPILEESIGKVLDDLLARNILGEASGGLTLRAGQVV